MKKRSLLSLFISLLVLGLSKDSFAQNEVIYIWSGGVTPYSVNVNAKLTDTSSTVRLVLSQTPQFTAPLFSSYYSVDTNTNMMVAMTINGLIPATKYYYAVESGGVIDSSADDVGSFTTFQSGPCSFSFTVGSCNIIANNAVYNVMGSMDPDFHLASGDLHYMNPNSATDVNVHRDPYENVVLSQSRPASFFKKTPIAYMWDDHDFCGNDCDCTFVGKKNARQAYREYVPHYYLPTGNGNAAIYQSFVAGRVRFILSDLRSDRYQPSMMGSQQKAWFKNECIQARNSNQIIAWVSSVTWNSVGNYNDNWAAFTTERSELADFFRDSSIYNMFILSGDAHMLAIDDGTHADFATMFNNGSLFPIFQAAALGQNGGYKGGTFSEGGYFPNPSSAYSQFGLVNVYDNGGNNICISFSGFRYDTTAAMISFVDYYNFCRTLGPVVAGVNNLENEQKTNLFPDPSDGKFVFTSDQMLTDPVIEVRDIRGTVIKPTSVNLFPNSIECDIANSSPGIYFVKVISGINVFEKKVVISK